MDFLNQITENIPQDKVQKLHLIEVMEYIIDADTETQIRLLNLLDSQMGLTPISKAKDILGKSYNGVKKFGNTVKVAGKTFAIIKG